MWWHWQETEEGVRTITVKEMARKLLPLFRPYTRQIILALFLLLIITAAQIAGPVILGRIIIDKYIKSDPNIRAIIGVGVLYFAIATIGVVVQYFQAILLFRIGISIITDFKHKLFSHIMRLGLNFFNEHPPGKLISRVEADADTIRNLFGEVLVNMLKNLFLFLGIFGVMFLINWRLTLYVVILVPLMFAAVFFFLKKIRRYYKEIRAQWAIVTGYTTEYVQGVDVIQQFNYQDHARRRMHEVNLGRYKIEVPTAYLDYGFWGGFIFGEIIAIAIILIVGARQILNPAAYENPLTIGTLIMFIEFMRQMFWPILQVGEQLNFIQRAFVSAERIFSILETKPTETDGPRPAEKLKFEREIAFENVWFAYEGDQWVLEDVSFKLPKGSRLALVGTSGGGKSTIVNLLLRFYDPQKGRITADGVDIREYPIGAWRSLMGLVLQDIYLFPGTIQDNLRVFNEEVDLEKIKRVSEIVRANRFIEKLPGGYEGELAERGTNLSVGERQLLSFARALTKDPPVLILDEATSSVDPHTERLIQDAIEKLLEGRTAVIVAHRLSTILSADEILLIHDGRVAEAGKHEQLLALGGLYAKLYRLQFADAKVVE
jgi:ABC-type multidrug transport system fused ATPase/permease subunit